MADWMESESFFTNKRYKDLSGVKRLRDGSFDFESFIACKLKLLSEDLRNSQIVRKTKRPKSIVPAGLILGEGDARFLNHDSKAFGECLELYTKSIAYAVPGHEVACHGYSRRSALLMKLLVDGHPEDAIKDVEQALECKGSEKMGHGLWLTIGNCYSDLAEESYIDAKIWLSKVPEENRRYYENKLKEYPTEHERYSYGIGVDIEHVVPELESRNSKYPCASDAIDVRYTKELGRHIAATRDIEVGEVLAIEEPYSKYINFENMYTHCSHCLRYTFRGIPCDNCISVIYCSQKCKSEAWEKSHDVYCTIYDLMLQYDESPYLAEPIRFLIEMTRSAGGLSELKEKLNDLRDSDGT